MTNNVGIIIAVGVIGAAIVFWKPTICEALNNLTSGQFDMCTFQSTSDTTHDHSAPSPEPGVLTGGRHPHVRHKHDTTVSTPAHQQHVAVHHQHLTTHNNTAIHTAHKKLQAKHNAPGGHHLPHLTQAQKCAADICKTHQCLNCPPPPAKASLAMESHYRMSGW